MEKIRTFAACELCGETSELLMEVDYFDAQGRDHCDDCDVETSIYQITEDEYEFNREMIERVGLVKTMEQLLAFEKIMGTL